MRSPHLNANLKQRHLEGNGNIGHREVESVNGHWDGCSMYGQPRFYLSIGLYGRLARDRGSTPSQSAISLNGLPVGTYCPQLPRPGVKFLPFI